MSDRKNIILGEENWGKMTRAKDSEGIFIARKPFLYLVFAWDTYYPTGGFNDLQFKASSIEEITDNVKKNVGSGWCKFAISKTVTNVVLETTTTYWKDCNHIQIIRTSDWLDVTKEIVEKLSTRENC